MYVCIITIICIARSRTYYRFSVEGTARLGMELGYHVTLIRDATAAFSHL